MSIDDAKKFVGGKLLNPDMKPGIEWYPRADVLAKWLDAYATAQNRELVERVKELESQTVWVVRYGNYYPAEIDAIFASKEVADRHAEALGGAYEVQEWEVRTTPAEVSKDF